MFEKFYKKLLIIVTIIGLSLSLFGCNNQDVINDQADENVIKTFNELLDKQFVYDLENDSYGRYVMIENPDNYHIDTNKTEVRIINPERMDISLEEFKKDNEYLYQALELDYDKLDSRHQDYYDSLDFILDINEELTDDKFDYYEQLFTRNNNPTNTLAQTLFDFNLRDEESVKFLIDLFNSTDEYTDACIEYAREQLNRGLLMMDADFLLDYNESVISEDKEAMLEGIFNNIDELGLDESYKTELLNLANTVFNDNLLKINDFIKEAKASGKIHNGTYADFEYGQEYVALLLKNYTGEDINPEEYLEYLASQIDKYLTKLSVILNTNTTLLDELVKNGDRIDANFKSYQEILEFANSKMQEDFPLIGDINYVIKDINQAVIGEANVMAYYWVSPLDNTRSEQMRVNPKYADLNSLSTYTTVTHEGLPGHMYQRNYIRQNCDNNYMLAFGDVNKSMQEGYANYVGYYAMNYLDFKLSDVYVYNEMIFNLIMLVADYSINYLGKDEAVIGELFTQLGFGLDDEYLTYLYETLKNDPLMFVPYYYGLARIYDFRDEAINELGNKFSDYDFHKALLDGFNMPFEIVEKHIDNYIEAK